MGPEGLDRGAGPALTLLLQAYRPQNIDLLYRGRASVSWLGAQVLAEQREASAGVRVHAGPSAVLLPMSFSESRELGTRLTRCHYNAHYRTSGLALLRLPNLTLSQRRSPDAGSPAALSYELERLGVDRAPAEMGPSAPGVGGKSPFSSPLTQH